MRYIVHRVELFGRIYMVELSKAMNLHVKLWGIIMIICKIGVIAVTNIREEMTKMILSLFLFVSRDPQKLPTWGH